MTDGNMAIPVSPVSEEDMSKLRQTFDQALNALVGMSKLARDVEVLQTKVGDLTNQVNRYRSQIDTLDEALYRTRQERDEARTAVSAAVQAKEHAESKLYEVEQTVEHLRQDNASLNDRLVTARRESDDHMMRALEAEDKLAAANKKLEEVREHFKTLFPEVPSNAPAVAVVEPHPENVVTIPVIPQEPHTDTAIPHPVQEPKAQDKPWWEKENELITPTPKVG